MSAPDRSPSLADLAPVERFALFARAQRGIRDPLPTDLLEVLDEVDDLEHFVAVRRAQEREP